MGDGRWQKGQSGNPGGKPAALIGLAKMIREKTQDGSALVEFYWRVFSGQSVDEFGLTPTMAQRMEAAQWLSDRGFGRAVTPIDLTTNGEGLPQLPFDPRKLSEATLLELAKATVPKVIDVGGGE